MKPCVCIKMEEMANVCTESEDDGRVSRLICGIYRVPAACGGPGARRRGADDRDAAAARLSGRGEGSGGGPLQRAAAAALRPTKLQNPGCFEMNLNQP